MKVNSRSDGGFVSGLESANVQRRLRGVESCGMGMNLDVVVAVVVKRCKYSEKNYYDKIREFLLFFHDGTFYKNITCCIFKMIYYLHFILYSYYNSMSSCGVVTISF